MAKKTNGVNRSEEIRKLLKANPKISAKEVAMTLAAKGIKVNSGLYYMVKGQMLGRKSRRTRAQKAVTNVTAAVTHATRSDAVSTILKVKAWSKEVGGMKNLKALVEALSD
jgi:hypothetical protein